MGSTVTALSDERALIAQATAEPAAFAAIYDHYFPRVYTYVRYRVADAAAADDVTSQVFEQVLANLRRYSPERGSFAAWLFAIARNATSDHLRAQSRRRWLSLEMIRERASAEPQPQEIALRDETKAQLLAAIGRLRDREREVIGLRFAAGLANSEIARLMDLSAGHVGVILYRALRRLRAQLDMEGVNE